MFDIESLKSKSDTELTKISKDLGIGEETSDINEKFTLILDFQASNPQTIKGITSDHGIKGNDAGNEEAAMKT